MKKEQKPNYYKDVLEILVELKQTYPSYSLGRHLATAFDGYSDLWDVTDKEALYALNKYIITLQMDVPRETDEKELERIIRDGISLDLTTEDNYNG